MRSRSFKVSALAMLCSAPLPCQVKAQDTFEVASVRHVANDAIGRTATGWNMNPDMVPAPKGDEKQLRYPAVTLRALITRAYNIELDQIAGPSWLAIDRYEVIAKMPEDSSVDHVDAMWACPLG